MTQFQGWIFSGFLLLGMALPSLAVTRYVDVDGTAPASPYTNWTTAAVAIQTAIDAAVSEDEILVAPGLYVLTGDAVQIPVGKTLTLRSTKSREAIIDAQRLSRVLEVNGSNSWVEGFTIRNGLYEGAYGGGVFLGAPSRLKDCLVTSNQAYGAGGVMIYDGGVVVQNCTIQSNLATYFGGGVVFYAASPGLLISSRICDNIASNYAGGVECQGAGTVANCWISGNQAIIEGGGGVEFENGGSLINSVVVNNHAAQRGGGIESSSGKIQQCTVISNTAGLGAGGIQMNSGTSWNSIVYFNTAPSNANIQMYSLAAFSNCCTVLMPMTNGSTCFTTAPTFQDMAGADFHLATASSCIDAGATNGAPSIDFDGHMRPRTGTPGGTAEFDVGAFEYGFHFNEIQSLAPNQVELVWDVQNRGIYWVDATTNGLDAPDWFNVESYTNGGGLGVHTQTVAIPSPIPPYAGFRLRVGHTIF